MGFLIERQKVDRHSTSAHSLRFKLYTKIQKIEKNGRVYFKISTNFNLNKILISSKNE